ncbi:ion channel [Clostridium sp. MB05]|uniref:potassium channel family protein n=1 Tax=Clostridium sp. MB05 TaxID=3376682 RepID=UPI003982ABE9
MGSFIIILTTIIALAVLIVRSVRNNRKIKSVLGTLIVEINKTYKELFKGRTLLYKITQGGMVICGEVFAFITIFTTIMRYFNTHLSFGVEWLIKILAIIISFIIVHYSIGYILFVSSKIHKFIYKVEDKNLKLDFILSYFITSTFLAVLIVFPDQFKKNAAIGIIGVIICYYLNIKVLITLMRKPHNIKSEKEEKTNFARVLIAAILVLVMLVMNMYLAVCFVNALADGAAYLNATGSFDLFYYTMITFTTIGYGDIVPVTTSAKVVAIVISITSVICLTVFLGSILSYKEKFDS